jgi:hypothetical protein
VEEVTDSKHFPLDRNRFRARPLLRLGRLMKCLNRV